ncbi:hypothetical protein [Streptomyces lunaelactis]|nr:hypothetical protein [Streptomyces lunaelactis]
MKLTLRHPAAAAARNTGITLKLAGATRAVAHPAVSCSAGASPYL